jgi:hypothetical protein
MDLYQILKRENLEKGKKKNLKFIKDNYQKFLKVLKMN